MSTSVAKKEASFISPCCDCGSDEFQMRKHVSDLHPNRFRCQCNCGHSWHVYQFDTYFLSDKAQVIAHRLEKQADYLEFVHNFRAQTSDGMRACEEVQVDDSPEGQSCICELAAWAGGVGHALIRVSGVRADYIHSPKQVTSGAYLLISRG